MCDGLDTVSRTRQILGTTDQIGIRRKRARHIGDPPTYERDDLMRTACIAMLNELNTPYISANGPRMLFVGTSVGQATPRRKPTVTTKTRGSYLVKGGFEVPEAQRVEYEAEGVDAESSGMEYSIQKVGWADLGRASRAVGRMTRELWYRTYSLELDVRIATF
ncbi:hypothetical protein C8J56DRAFT_886972 [Mycena floridula]|nr:hypothetical protein C8J56DRAFT_886972 [Mycena floridula]